MIRRSFLKALGSVLGAMTFGIFTGKSVATPVAEGPPCAANDWIAMEPLYFGNGYRCLDWEGRAMWRTTRYVVVPEGFKYVSPSHLNRLGNLPAPLPGYKRLCTFIKIDPTRTHLILISTDVEIDLRKSPNSV